MPELSIPVVTVVPQLSVDPAVGELPLDPSAIPAGGDFSHIFSSLLESLAPAAEGIPLQGEALPQADLAAEQPAQIAADGAALIPFLPANLTPAVPLKPAEIVEAKAEPANPFETRLDSGADPGMAAATAPQGEPLPAANFAAAGISLPALAAEQPAIAGVKATTEKYTDLVAAPPVHHPVADTPAGLQALPEPAMRPANVAAGQRAVANVEPHLNRGEWGDAFSQKVVWVVNQQHQVADIQINPPNLGPVEVRLSLNQDQASLMFISPHAAVRDAIQSALPRLNEMMANSGLSLGDVFVGSEAAQQQAYGEQTARGRQHASEAAGGAVQSGVLPLSSRHHGMVDLFA